MKETCSSRMYMLKQFSAVDAFNPLFHCSWLPFISPFQFCFSGCQRAKVTAGYSCINHQNHEVGLSKSSRYRVHLLFILWNINTHGEIWWEFLVSRIIIHFTTVTQSHYCFRVLHRPRHKMRTIVHSECHIVSGALWCILYGSFRSLIKLALLAWILEL